MCFNCGCRIPQDDMGNPDNIHTQMMEKLAQKWDLTLPEVEQIFLDYSLGKNVGDKDAELEMIFEKASLAWGQSIDDAKLETAKLLSS